MRKVGATGTALAAFLMASSAWGAAAPEPGKYLAKIAVVYVSGPQCHDRLGIHYDGIVEYPGLKGTQITIRIPIILDGYPVIDLQTLKITSGVGTVRTRGRLSIFITDPINQRFVGSFEAVLTLSDDPQAFRARVTETVPLMNCTEVFSLALTRSG
jgi:hypothetical protein